MRHFDELRQRLDGDGLAGHDRRGVGARVLDVLDRSPLPVTRVLPGTALVARRRNVVVQQVPGAAVVAKRGKAVVEPLGEAGAFILSAAGPGLRDRPTERRVFEILLVEHLRQVFDLFGVNCVIDVGANKGQYATALRKAGYKGRIVSFEPVPAVAQQLHKAAKKDRRWHVHEVALAREDGTTKINVVPGTMSSVLPATDFGNERFRQLREPVVQEVAMRRLDGMMDQILDGIQSPRPFLKLDTQGFDLEVFAGLGARSIDLMGLQSEVSLVPIYEGMPRLPESLRVFEGAGFEVTGFYPVTREGRTARVLEFDCVMVRPGAQLGA